jgi:hypothetical protein
MRPTCIYLCYILTLRIFIIIPFASRNIDVVTHHDDITSTIPVAMLVALLQFRFDLEVRYVSAR